MSTSTILTLLILCAALLLCGGLLLIVAVAVLWFVLGRGGDEELEAPAEPRPVPAAPSAPSPAPGPRSLDAALAHTAQASRRPEEALKAYGGVEDDGGKTEVFTRGNLNLDWDDDHVEGEATEIFRADLHNHDDFKMD